MRDCPKAMFAARWIDQRLREVVTHYRPMADAVDDAFHERHPPGSLGKTERQRARQKLAGRFCDARARALAEADSLLSMRGQLAPHPDALPAVPADVLGELRRMRREHEEYMAKLAAELDWIDRAVEYSREVARAGRDGDTPPNPRDYGVGDGGDADGEGDE